MKPGDGALALASQAEEPDKVLEKELEESWPSKVWRSACKLCDAGRSGENQKRTRHGRRVEGVLA